MEGNGTKNVESAIFSDGMGLYDPQTDFLNFSPTHLKKGCGNSTNIPDIEITGTQTKKVNSGQNFIYFFQLQIILQV
jgi:hypothetical protein